MGILRLLGLENPIVPLRKEAEAGDPDAQFLLAEAYLVGGDPYVLPRDDEQAVHFYQKAADQNHPEAQAKLGELYWGGNCGLPKDVTKAAYWYRRAEKNGHHEALVSIALIHSNADGPDHRLPDLPNDELFALHKKGAELNLSFCQHELGTLYFEGKVTPRDLVKAHAWYKVASENGRKVWQFQWQELLAQMTPEEKAQANHLANELRTHLAAEKRAREQQRENRESKPWRRKRSRQPKKGKAFVSDVDWLLRKAESTEERLAYLKAAFAVLLVLSPAFILRDYILPPNMRTQSAINYVVGTALYLYCANFAATTIFWHTHQKSRLIRHYLNVFTRVKMPKRLYSHDRAGTYIFRILNGPDDYGPSEITPDVIETAKDIEREIKWRSQHLGGFSEGRFTDVIEEVLKLYSPADLAPPYDNSESVCQWVNGATAAEIEQLSYVGPNDALEIIKARPFGNRRNLYSFLLNLHRERLGASRAYLEISKAAGRSRERPSNYAS